METPALNRLALGDQIAINGCRKEIVLCMLMFAEPTSSIKTVTVKRDSVGRLWLCFSVLEKLCIPEEVSAGEIGGFDFGLQTFLWVAFKRGKRVIFLDRWTPTTQTCSNCGERQKLDLKQRTFACGHCGLTLDRDHNAAINIRAGASAHTARGEVRLSSDSIAVDGRSPRL